MTAPIFGAPITAKWPEDEQPPPLPGCREWWDNLTPAQQEQVIHFAYGLKRALVAVKVMGLDK